MFVLEIICQALEQNLKLKRWLSKGFGMLIVNINTNVHILGLPWHFGTIEILFGKFKTSLTTCKNKNK